MTVHLTTFQQKEIVQLNRTLKQNFIRASRQFGSDSQIAKDTWKAYSELYNTLQLFGYTFHGDVLIQNTKKTNAEVKETILQAV